MQMRSNQARLQTLSLSVLFQFWDIKTKFSVINGRSKEHFLV